MSLIPENVNMSSVGSSLFQILGPITDFNVLDSSFTSGCGKHSLETLLFGRKRQTKSIRINKLTPLTGKLFAQGNRLISCSGLIGEGIPVTPKCDLSDLRAMCRAVEKTKVVHNYPMGLMLLLAVILIPNFLLNKSHWRFLSGNLFEWSAISLANPDLFKLMFQQGKSQFFTIHRDGLGRSCLQIMVGMPWEWPFPS